MSTWEWFALAAIGAFGASLRYLVDTAVQQRLSGEFPVGTLVINLSGSLLLGLISGLVLYHAFPATPKLLLGSGFCGAYTTFSTFAFESAALVEDGAITLAVVNVLGSAVLGTTFAAAGLLLASI